MATNKLKQPFKPVWVVLPPGWESRVTLLMLVGLDPQQQGLVMSMVPV